jgi:hypothetical protein
MIVLVTVIAMILAIALVQAVRERDRHEHERAAFRHITGAPRWWGEEVERWRHEDYPARR